MRFMMIVKADQNYEAGAPPDPKLMAAIGGIAIVQAKSKAEAIELGKRFMLLHQEVLGPSWEGSLEVRQLFDPSDFAPPGA